MSSHLPSCFDLRLILLATLTYTVSMLPGLYFKSALLSVVGMILVSVAIFWPVLTK